MQNYGMEYDNYRHWIQSRILSRSVKGVGGCVEYVGNSGHDYGLISVTVDGVRKSVPAHRALWMAENDRLDLPREVQVRHKCDNPRCVNIEHLQAGTAKDNMRDCVERGRRAKKYISHKRVRVHDDAKILAIREAAGSNSEIADKFGVSVSYVSRIRSGKVKLMVVAPEKKPVKLWGSST